MRLAKARKKTVRDPIEKDVMRLDQDAALAKSRRLHGVKQYVFCAFNIAKHQRRWTAEFLELLKAAFRANQHPIAHII